MAQRQAADLLAQEHVRPLCPLCPLRPLSLCPTHPTIPSASPHPTLPRSLPHPTRTFSPLSPSHPIPPSHPQLPSHPRPYPHFHPICERYFKSRVFCYTACFHPLQPIICQSIIFPSIISPSINYLSQNLGYFKNREVANRAKHESDMRTSASYASLDSTPCSYLLNNTMFFFQGFLFSFSSKRKFPILTLSKHSLLSPYRCHSHPLQDVRELYNSKRHDFGHLRKSVDYVKKTANYYSPTVQCPPVVALTILFRALTPFYHVLQHPSAMVL